MSEYCDYDERSSLTAGYLFTGKCLTTKTLPSNEFEKRMISAGYYEVETALAQGGRIKVWWSHNIYPRVESIYSYDRSVVITAYHV